MYTYSTAFFNENSIFSIIMSTIKAINDGIITRNDFISILIIISVTSFRENAMTGND